MSQNLSPKTPAQRVGERWMIFFFCCALVGTVTGAMALMERWATPPAIQIYPPPTVVATPFPLVTAALVPTVLPFTSTSTTLDVMVNGAVRQPGLYELPTGSTLSDALKMAGGLTDQADPSAIDLSELLVDGAIVTIPSASNTNKQASSLINLNSASAAELESLPGIGPQLARAIIEHRPYQHLSDLNRVPGLAQTTINRLRGLVTVE
ncbi:MAG: ComEA family DNA-binding protein [Caldilineaceae bacterium]